MKRRLEGEELERFIANCPERHVPYVRKYGVVVVSGDDFMASLREHLDRRPRANSPPK